SGAFGAISPGELITIYGQALSDDLLVASPDSSGIFPFFLGNTRILIDGKPSALIYTSPTQVAVMVPYSCCSAKQNVLISVQNANGEVGRIQLPTGQASPAI